MLIDWFTVVAQIVNFLILVFLLHRFLYRPIVGHMTAREEKIKQEFEGASDKKKAAQDQIEEFRRKSDDLDKEVDKKIEQAQAQAKQRKKELLDEAQKHVEDQRTTWLQALEKEKEAFAREFQKRGSQEILNYVRRIMKDLADESLNNRLARVLADRIGNLGQEDKEKLQRAARAEDVIISSTFELDSAEKRKLTTVLHEICGKDAVVAYQTDGDYPLGIEARAGNIRLSWGIKSYLEELKARVMSVVEEKTDEKSKGNGDGSKDKTEKKEKEKEKTEAKS